MAGFFNEVVYGLNADFSTKNSLKGLETNGLVLDKQLWIGSTAANAGGTHINVGTITSPLGTISIGYASPNITLDITGGAVAIEKVALQTGTTPIVPLAGVISFNGSTVAAGSNPVRTDGTGANTMALEVQISQALVATDATKIGLSNFNSSQFTVDANGFVGLKGSSSNPGILGVHPNAISGTGTDPTIADASGNISILGSTVAAGSNPIRTIATAVNSLTTQVQISQAIAGTDATKIGLSAFSNAQFSVDANGFVTLANGQAVAKVGVDANTAPGTNPVLPTAAGLITITGAQVASGTIGANVIRTDSLAANTYTIEIQRSAANATTDSTKNGVAHFNSAQFSVDANGFVSVIIGAFAWSDVSGAFSPLKENGYFVTGTATGTLPASPAQGDTIKFFVDHASQFLTIRAAGTQLIRLGTLVSSAGGTAISTKQDRKSVV